MSDQVTTDDDEELARIFSRIVTGETLTDEMRQVFMRHTGQDGFLGNLDNWVPIDIGLYHFSDTITGAVEAVEQELSGTEACGRMHLSNLRKHLKVLLLNIAKAYLIDPRKHVSFSRGRTYPQDNRNNPIDLTDRSCARIADGLIELGYVEQTIGTRNPETEQRWRTRLRAFGSFGERLVGEFGITPADVITTKLDPIRLRNTAKDYIPYRDRPAQREMRSRIDAYNDNLAEAELGLSQTGQEMSGSPNDADILIRRQAYRVFSNGSFDQGGRFYGPWWVNTDEDIRKHILIDGEPTIEADFNAMQIHALYSMRGLNYYGRNNVALDPYTVGMDEPDELKRKIRKRLWSNSFNAVSRTAAIRGYCDWARKQKNCHQYFSLELGPVLDEFLECHPAISDFRYSGIGLTTQNCDAQVADKILTDLTNQGIVVLGVHDSFIVKERHRALLENAMNYAIRESEFTSIPRILVE